MSINAPTALSFFSGAMGLDLGLHLAGFKFKAFVEIDKTCQETIRRNLYSWLWNKAKENFKENIQSLQTSLTKKE